MLIEIKERLEDIKDSMIYKLDDIKHFLINVVSYSKFAWTSKDRNWDYMYAIDLLSWKLGKLRDHIAENNHSGQVKRNSRDINNVIKLFNIRKGMYGPYGKKHIENWGEITGGLTEFSFEKCKTDEDTAQAKAELYQAYEKDEEYMERSFKLAFKIIEKRIHEWWD